MMVKNLATSLMIGLTATAVTLAGAGIAQANAYSPPQDAPQTATSTNTHSDENTLTLTDQQVRDAINRASSKVTELSSSTGSPKEPSTHHKSQATFSPEPQSGASLDTAGAEVITISLDDKAAKPGTPLKDSVVYPTDKGYSYALSTQDSSLSGYVVINGKNTPTAYSFNIDINGSPAVLEKTDAGKILIKDQSGKIVKTIGQAWARDASGKSVSTSYSVAGGKLIQTVDHQGATYPVVADPKVIDEGFSWKYGYSVRIDFNKKETEFIASGAWSSLSATCALGGPIVVAACGVAVALALIPAKIAQSNGECVYMRRGILNIFDPLGVGTYSGGNCT